MPSFDDIVNAVPGTPQQKATIAAIAVAIYGIALVARGFTREGSKAHAVCDFIVNGLRPKPAATVIGKVESAGEHIQTEPPKSEK